MDSTGTNNKLNVNYLSSSLVSYISNYLELNELFIFGSINKKTKGSLMYNQLHQLCKKLMKFDIKEEIECTLKNNSTIIPQLRSLIEEHFKDISLILKPNEKQLENLIAHVLYCKYRKKCSRIEIKNFDDYTLYEKYLYELISFPNFIEKISVFTEKRYSSLKKLLENSKEIKKLKIPDPVLSLGLVFNSLWQDIVKMQKLKELTITQLNKYSLNILNKYTVLKKLFLTKLSLKGDYIGQNNLNILIEHLKISKNLNHLKICIKDVFFEKIFITEMFVDSVMQSNIKILELSIPELN
jgi:hypothetical protein